MRTQDCLTRVIVVAQVGSFRISLISHITVSLASDVFAFMDAMLTNFTELSIAPHLNHQLVPAHLKSTLASKGLDIDNFQPLTKDQMIARLD